MNIPAIPTGNLYKFCAISGVVLILFAITYPIQKLFAAQAAVVSVTTDVAVLTKKSAFLRADMDHLKSYVKHTSDEITLAAKKKRPDNLDELASRAKRSQKSLSVIKMKARKLQITAIKLHGKNKQASQLLWQIWAYLIAAAICGLGGISLGSYGFRRWYFLVQRPSDELLARQLNGNDT